MKKSYLMILFVLMFTWIINGAVTLNETGKYYDIASDNNNVIHIVWLDDSSVAWYGQIVYQGGTWLITNKENTGATAVVGKKHRPRLHIRPDGQEVHFSWVNSWSAPNAIKHCWKNTSGVWQTETVHTTSNPWQYQYADVAIDGNGVTHVVASYFRTDQYNYGIKYHRKPAGGSWDHSQPDIAPANNQNLWSALYEDYNGNVHVAWTEGKVDIKYKYCTAGGYLSSATTLTVPRHTETDKTSRPEIYVDKTDLVHLAYQAHSRDDSGASSWIDYSTKPVSGGSFSASVHASVTRYPSPAPNYYIPTPDVVALSTSTVAVSWCVDNSDVYVTSNYSGSWALLPGYGPLVTDARLWDKHSRPVMALSDTMAYMVWRGNSAGNMFQLETYDLDPGPTTYDLTVQSSPATGVNITITPNDNNENGDGTTEFTRVYDSDTVVTATAPAINNGGDFLYWDVDGVRNIFRSISFTMNMDHTIIAHFEDPPAATKTVTVQSYPASGATITISPNDNNNHGNGATNLTRIYNRDTVVTLTAPASYRGGKFLYWDLNGYRITHRSISYSMDKNYNIRAIFDPPPIIIIKRDGTPPDNKIIKKKKDKKEQKADSKKDKKKSSIKSKLKRR